MKQSIEEIVKNLNCAEDIGTTLVELAKGAGREAYRRGAEALDALMFKLRDKTLKVEHKRERWVSTPLGDVRVKRREYVGANGERRCLLDEVLGLEGRSPIVSEVRETGIFLATLLPFQKSSEVMKKSLPEASVSHATIHRLAKGAAEPCLEREAEARKRLNELGELPGGEGRMAPRLLLEGDGVMIALQREKEKKAEVKVGIAYEGWEEVGKDRHRLSQKTCYCAIAGEDSFWEGFTLKLAQKYDLAGIRDIVVGGDGASWVKTGADLFQGTFQLDRFHLLRALRRALGADTALIPQVYTACDRGDWPAALALLNQARGRTRGEPKEKIDRLIVYLTDNLAGLKDYRLDRGIEGKALRRTGAIESNVDKLVANRMKKRGMSWTKKGARRMVCLLVAAAEGNLSRLLRSPRIPERANLSLKKVRRMLTKCFSEPEATWLQAGVPALSGPHVNRPWVQALKSLTEVSARA